MMHISLSYFKKMMSQYFIREIYSNRILENPSGTTLQLLILIIVNLSSNKLRDFQRMWNELLVMEFLRLLVTRDHFKETLAIKLTCFI